MAIKAGTQVQLYGAMCQHTNTDTHTQTHTHTPTKCHLAHACPRLCWFRLLRHQRFSGVSSKTFSLVFCFFLLCFAEPSSNAPDRRSFMKWAEASTRLLFIAKPVCSQVTGNQSELTTNLGWFLLLTSNSNLPKYLGALWWLLTINEHGNQASVTSKERILCQQQFFTSQDMF